MSPARNPAVAAALPSNTREMASPYSVAVAGPSSMSDPPAGGHASAPGKVGQHRVESGMADVQTPVLEQAIPPHRVDTGITVVPVHHRPARQTS